MFGTARDEFSGKTVYRPVTNLFRRTAPRIVHLSLDAPNGKREVLKVTSEHPFFVKGKGWTEVRKLVPGDQIVSGKGGFLAIANMRSESNPTLVYNFEVAQNHNYFVGEEGALAHNAKFDSRKARRAWENFYGQNWPQDDKGRNYQVHHIKYLCNGGAKYNPLNIMPLLRKDHIDLHSKLGDFSKWGRGGI